MIEINPITQAAQTAFKSKNRESAVNLDSPDNTESKKQKSRKHLEAALIGLAAAGSAAIIGAPYTKKTILQNLKVNGLEIRNGLTVSSKTGEKFTGTIKHNSKAYGREKEVVSYVDGKTTEILHYSFTGKEVNGLFFKDGKPFIRIGDITRNKKHQFFPVCQYDSNGKPNAVAEGLANPGESVFECTRESINKKS